MSSHQSAAGAAADYHEAMEPTIGHERLFRRSSKCAELMYSVINIFSQ
jgi:hypothetical protein